ncbi:MAG TPA: outer membrane beta-barrel protein [Rubrivivax sp.]
MSISRCLGRLLPLSLMACAMAAVAAPENDTAVTFYGGYRSGGSGLTDANSGDGLTIESSAAGAISLDFGLDARRQVQLYFAHQNTRLNSDGSTTSGDGLRLKVSYLHLGGTVFFEGPVGRGPYVVGGLGATVFDPSGAGYSTEVRPSMNVGIGYQFLLGERVALRAEARGYVTLVNSSGGFFCSGGCVIAIQGDTVTQADVQLGLSFRF